MAAAAAAAADDGDDAVTDVTKGMFLSSVETFYRYAENETVAALLCRVAQALVIQAWKH